MSWPQTHVSPDDRFCFYCQRQYATVATFGNHVRRVHGDGLAIRVGLLNADGTINAEYPVNTRGRRGKVLASAPATRHRAGHGDPPDPPAAETITE